jgi:hypothetical protein
MVRTYTEKTIIAVSFMILLVSFALTRLGNAGVLAAEQPISQRHSTADKAKKPVVDSIGVDQITNDLPPAQIQTEADYNIDNRTILVVASKTPMAMVKSS